MNGKTLLGKLAPASFILFGTLAFGQQAWDFPDFSATEVIQTSKTDMPSKLYRSGPSVRVDRSAALSVLFTPATHKTYNLTTYPDNSHQCVVMNPDQAKMMPSPLALLQGTNVKRTPAGTEVVEGHSSKIEEVVATQPDGKIVEAKVWEAEDLKGIPVKIEAKFAGKTLNAVYRDIVIGAPDAALFAVPEKCTPFDKMGQVVERKTLK